MIRHPLRIWREERGITLRQFGHAIGMSYTLVSNLERGKGNPTIRIIGRICRYTGLSADLFLPPPEAKGVRPCD